MIKIQNQDLAIKIKEIFKSYMKEKGYEIWKSEDPEMGITYTASKEYDKYIPLIELSFGSQSKYKSSEFELLVLDRDGVDSLHGEFVAKYYLHTKYETDEDKILNEFKKILDIIYDKYGKYSRKNRLDFVFNNLEYETFDYLEKEDLSFYNWKEKKRKNEIM